MTKKKQKKKLKKLQKIIKWYRKRWVSEMLSQSMREKTRAW